MIRSFPVPPQLLIDKRFSDTVIMKTNSTKIIEVPFCGSPMPNIKWSFNGSPLPDPKRTTAETIRGMTALTISRAIRADAGTYKLVISNDLGSVSLTVTVIVKGENVLLERSVFGDRFQKIQSDVKIELDFHPS